METKTDFISLRGGPIKKPICINSAFPHAHPYNFFAPLGSAASALTLVPASMRLQKTAGHLMNVFSGENPRALFALVQGREQRNVKYDSLRTDQA